MKTTFFTLAAVVLVIWAHPTFGQGNLTPPGAPAPTMKTLSQIDSHLSQVEPRIPITSIPYLITNAGSYYVTTNLNAPAGMIGSGILIYAADVSIDLGGWTLKGTNGSSAGIFVDGSLPCTNLYIGNGILRNWDGGGIDAAATVGAQFEKLRVYSNAGIGGIRVGNGALISDCSANGNKTNGITASSGSTLVQCTAQNNSGHGIVLSGYGATVERCTSTFNTGRGISVDSGSHVIRGCTASFNQGNGIHATAGTVENCYANYNQGVGIFASGGVVANCHSANNTFDGIQVGGYCRVVNNHACFNGSNGNTNFAGIHATGAANLIDSNTTIANNSRGIKVDAQGGGNVIIRNRSYAQGVGNYDIAPVNDVGPFNTATNSTSPWANLY